MEREGEEKKKGQATVETGGRERIASFARGGGQAKLESKMGRAATDGFEKGSRRDRARHYHFRALRHATDMKQPVFFSLWLRQHYCTSFQRVRIILPATIKQRAPSIAWAQVGMDCVPTLEA